MDEARETVNLRASGNWCRQSRAESMRSSVSLQWRRQISYKNKIQGIYAIRNLISGRVYVGSSVYIQSRWHCHTSALRRNKHHSKPLQSSWNKHGQEAFTFSILELVSDSERMVQREQYWMDTLQSFHPTRGFNCCPRAGKNCTGRKHSNETKAKLSAAGKGRKLSAEQIEKQSAARIGYKTPQETKDKISAKLKGRVFTPEWRAKMRASWRPKNISPEGRERQRRALIEARRRRKMENENPDP